MPWLPATVPPSLMAAGAGGRMIKKRAGLPKLLHKLFIKVLRLSRPPAAEDCYGYRVGADEESYCCCCYSYGGAGSSSWAGVLCSIPEEGYDDDEDDDSSDEGTTPDVAAVVRSSAAVLRKAKSERFIVGPPDAATVVHVEVLL